jgi:hypothetical protein
LDEALPGRENKKAAKCRRQAVPTKCRGTAEHMGNCGELQVAAQIKKTFKRLQWNSPTNLLEEPICVAVYCTALAINSHPDA